MFSLAGSRNGLPGCFDRFAQRNLPPSCRLNLRSELRSYGDGGSRRAGTYWSAESFNENWTEVKRVSSQPWWECRAIGSRKEAIAGASEGGIAEVKHNLRRRDFQVLIAAGVTVVLGVANKVLYKLALVPLRHYPFFLAQIATFGEWIVGLDEVNYWRNASQREHGYCSVGFYSAIWTL